jgi:hypothetical protein
MTVLAGLAAPAVSPAQGSGAFPHARHASMFPLCSSCHAGIATGDAPRSFPPITLCSTCHDGTVQARVRWAPPAPKGAGLLVFTHRQHASKAKDASCESCHALGDSTKWMNVAAATPERCISCHAHAAPAHLAEGSACATCHRPLTSAVALTDARVGALPKPPSHARADFAVTHKTEARASTASCAMCHARESCQRCHVDGAREPAIQALGTDARIMRLVAGKPAVYSTPADHRSAQFALMHGAAARADVSRCATCHARPSCETCHIGGGARDVIQRLPDARGSTAPGVQLRRAAPMSATDFPLLASASAHAVAPLQMQTLRHDTTRRVVRVHAAGFARAHGAQAASGGLECASCHAKRFCADCHTGDRVTRRYHVANFVSTHAPQAYRRETECSSCHSTEAFCRDCHRQTGLAATANTRSTVFHNAQALWLLQHGRAARQDLKSCATCHQQTYCMQCHSDLGSRNNPHGPGFDAARMASKNPQICLYCHFTNPLAK